MKLRCAAESRQPPCGAFGSSRRMHDNRLVMNYSSIEVCLLVVDGAGRWSAGGYPHERRCTAQADWMTHCDADVCL